MTKTPKRRVSPRSPSKKVEPVKVTRTAKAAKPSAKPTKINSAAKKGAKSKRTNKPNLKKNRLSQAVLDSRAGKAIVHWEQCFSDLQDFKKVHEHCLVPKMFKENQTLAYWVQRNRKHYSLFQDGEKSMLTAERIKRLEDMDFFFRARGADVQAEIEKKKKREKGVQKWNLHFGQMCEYKATNGNCLVPKLFKENRALASWVYNQRFQFKKKGEGIDVPLNDERIETLNEIGFCWKAKSDDEWRENDRDRRREKSQDGWDDKYSKLLTFKKKHGHTLVPKTYKTDQPLSSWVFRQRRQHGFRELGQRNSLSENRMKQLNDIEFAFRVRPEKKLVTPKATTRQARLQKVASGSGVDEVDDNEDDQNTETEGDAEAEGLDKSGDEMMHAVAIGNTNVGMDRRRSGRMMKTNTVENEDMGTVDEEDSKPPAKNPILSTQESRKKAKEDPPVEKKRESDLDEDSNLPSAEPDSIRNPLVEVPAHSTSEALAESPTDSISKPLAKVPEHSARESRKKRKKHPSVKKTGEPRLDKNSKPPVTSPDPISKPHAKVPDKSTMESRKKQTKHPSIDDEEKPGMDEEGHSKPLNASLSAPSARASRKKQKVRSSATEEGESNTVKEVSKPAAKDDRKKQKKLSQRRVEAKRIAESKKAAEIQKGMKAMKAIDDAHIAELGGDDKAIEDANAKVDTNEKDDTEADASFGGEADKEDVFPAEQKKKRKMYISSESDSSDEESSSSDDGSSDESSDGEMRVQKYDSDAYEKSDDELPVFVKVKASKNDRVTKEAKFPRRSLNLPITKKKTAAAGFTQLNKSAHMLQTPDKKYSKKKSKRKEEHRKK